MSVNIKPLADRVVAEPVEAESKTASGLYLPGGAQEKPKVAKVVAVGPDVKNIKVGDRILYEDYSNTDVKVDGKSYIIVKEEKVLATV
jgi:chaperonin GroES